MEFNYFKNLVKEEGALLPPLITQYIDVKSKHQDYLVLFRVGEFYELLFDDALEFCKNIAITLTRRKIKGFEIPMCGVPAHSHESYVAKLVSAGYKVAICDQIEDGKENKNGLVTRQVTHKITPGIVPYNYLLDDSDYNFVLMVYKNPSSKNFYYLCWADIATGDLFVEKIEKSLLINSLNSISPKEVVASKETLKEIQKHSFKAVFSEIKEAKSLREINNILQESVFLKQKDFLEDENTKFAVAYLLSYIKNIKQDFDCSLFKAPSLINSSFYLKLDGFTIKGLELVKNKDGFSANSLKSLIDNTLTNAGAKFLKSLILRPYSNHIAINERLKVVEFLIHNQSFANALKERFESFKNIQRCVGNILSKKQSFKDLITVKNAISYMHELKVILYSYGQGSSLLNNLFKNLDFNNNLASLLQDALLDCNEQDIDSLDSFVKRGFNINLDSCVDFLNNKEEKLSKIEREYREIYSSSKIKVSKNTIYGYYLSFPNSLSVDIDSNDLNHIQFLTNETRYKSKKLAELEFEILKNQNLKNELEKEIAEDIANKLIEQGAFLHQLVDTIAQIDVFYSLALVSSQEGFVKPTVEDSNNIIIKDGYHALLKHHYCKKGYKKVIENNLNMAEGDSFVHVLTAPNMAGKSTYLKQNAIIIILAQIGCYVPAQSATIGVRDAIYSRLGVYDDLLKDRSTFMVEMQECSFILNHASERSFVIFDEIGRGTSSKDGAAILQSIIEYVAKNLKCKAIFTTHYHEILDKVKDIKNLSLYTIEFDKENNMQFLYKVKKGVSTNSYGIFIASLAGLPESIIERAKSISCQNFKKDI